MTTTEKTSAEILRETCESTAKEWANLDVLMDALEVDEDERGAYAALETALDIVDYSRNGQWLGSRIAVCLGGPGVWVDTYAEEVVGVWGSDKVVVPLVVDEFILDALEETFDYRK